MKIFCSLFLIAILTSCGTSYEIVYNTYLPSSEKQNLHFEDSRFGFDFITVPNGIYFKIKNKQDTTAYIIWDKSYFILPSGNSYKALNTDILEADYSVQNKDNYESIIPSNSSFARFTTSAVYREDFSSYNTATINNYFNTNTNKYGNSFYRIANYWQVDIKGNTTNDSDVDYLSKNLKNISNKIKEQNNLGLGFTIKLGKNTLEYRFNFKIKKVEVYEQTESRQPHMRLKLIKVSKLPNIDEWENVEKTTYKE